MHVSSTGRITGLYPTHVNAHALPHHSGFLIAYRRLEQDAASLTEDDFRALGEQDPQLARQARLSQSIDLGFRRQRIEAKIRRDASTQRHRAHVDEFQRAASWSQALRPPVAWERRQPTHDEAVRVASTAGATFDAGRQLRTLICATVDVALVDPPIAIRWLHAGSHVQRHAGGVAVVSGGRSVLVPPITDAASAAVFLHEVGHQFQARGMDQIAAEVDAWRFALARAVAWDAACALKLSSSLRTYFADAKVGQLAAVHDGEALIAAATLFARSVTPAAVELFEQDCDAHQRGAVTTSTSSGSEDVASEWTPSRQYAAGEVVAYQGVRYRAVIAIGGWAPTSTVYWTRLVGGR